MQPSRSGWGIAAGISGFLALVMGAAGAHAVADPHAAALVGQASLYQLIHAGALLWLGGARGRCATLARWLFLAGTVLFCGTIYLKELAGWESAVRLAPVGGTSLMLGWLLIALAHGIQKRES